MDEKPGILWDLDGVLVDSGEAHYYAWKSTLADYGVPLPHDKFREIFGMNNESILRLLLGKRYDDDICSEISNRKEVSFRQAIRGHIQLLPGVLSLLQSIRQAQISQAIASSAPQANIDAILSELKLDSYFQAIVSASGMPGKPDPTVFLTAAEMLGVPPPKCIVIEDAPAGVEAARRAGMKCVAVTTTNPAVDLQSADAIVDRLDRISVEDLVGLVIS